MQLVAMQLSKNCFWSLLAYVHAIIIIISITIIIVLMGPIW